MELKLSILTPKDWGKTKLEIIKELGKCSDTEIEQSTGDLQIVEHTAQLRELLMAGKDNEAQSFLNKIGSKAKKLFILSAVASSFESQAKEESSDFLKR